MVMPRWCLLSVAFALLHEGVAAAQVPPPKQQGPTGVGAIGGEVFDSLVGARLQGAHLRVHGTSLVATTDARGRFRLESVPAGTRVLLLDHPALDSIGLSDLPKAVEVIAGRTTQVEVAVPSLRTFVATACAGSAPPLGHDSGIVFGSVRDAESGLRLAGATVTMWWAVVERTGTGPSVASRVRDVRTDSLGNYYVCDVATGIAVGAQASAGSFASGELQLEVGDRRVLRYDLSVSREALAAAGDTVRPSRRGLATIVGSVRAEDRGPLEGAQVSVPGTTRSDLTDSTGRFVLANLPSGSRMLYVRRVGYRLAAVPVELRNRDTTRVSFNLPAVYLLRPIRVTAARWSRAEVDELEERLRRGTGNRVLRSEDLRGIGAVSTTFHMFPSLFVQRRAGSVRVYMLRGARLCAPDVWLDGFPSDLQVLEALRPEDLFAIEVYPRTDVPLRYQRSYNCGAVLAWTRSFR